MKRVRVALCQINCRVGDIGHNVSKIKRNIKKALVKGADIVCFPELAVCGYPPEDLLLKPAFIQKNIEGLREIEKQAYPLTVVAGFVESCGLKNGYRLHNSAAVISGGKIAGIYRKTLLPNYGVFDENRYFEPGSQTPVFEGGGFKTGVNICEDIWFADGPVKDQTKLGAGLIVNISASPYSIGKPAFREKMLSERARENRVALAFCNMTGAQDELVFDGHSAFFDTNGNTTARARGFGEEMICADFDFEPDGVKNTTAPKGAQYRIRAPGRKKKPQIRHLTAEFAGEDEEIFSALVLGTRDYVGKNGFDSVIVGLSGGIDSALVAVIAVEALGSQKVAAINMPSVFSSKAGIRDSKRIALNLGIEMSTVAIDGIISSYKKHAPAPFKPAVGETSNTALENIQARIRGNILMAFSNTFGSMAVTTGNKSELSVGYSTLYGDTAGGFAVIKDVKKTLVYRLVRYYNKRRGFDAVPQSVIDRPPSAELKKGQKDLDALPPYEVLDEILKHYVEGDRSVAETVSLSGADRKTVRKVVDMVDGNEYKRRQSPPGIKLTDKAFGKDRRMPITNFYRN